MAGSKLACTSRGFLALEAQSYTHTHTHTHTCIYIYNNIYGREQARVRF